VNGKDVLLYVTIPAGLRIPAGMKSIYLFSGAGARCDFARFVFSGVVVDERDVGVDLVARELVLR
jgi:hypothetical protein